MALNPNVSPEPARTSWLPEAHESFSRKETSRFMIISTRSHRKGDHKWCQVYCIFVYPIIILHKMIKAGYMKLSDELKQEKKVSFRQFLLGWRLQYILKELYDMENAHLLMSETGIRKRLGHQLTSVLNYYEGVYITQQSLPPGDAGGGSSSPLYKPFTTLGNSGFSRLIFPRVIFSFFFLNTILKKVFCGQIMKDYSP